MADRKVQFNNSVGNSRILTFVKLQYYKLFSQVYAFSGSFADVVMVGLFSLYRLIQRGLMNISWIFGGFQVELGSCILHATRKT